MVNHIPSEIQVEIIIRLPVKSLIRFRSVSKAWRYMIDSPEFIVANSLRHTPQHLFVTYKNPLQYQDNYVSFVDDDTRPLQKFALTVPKTVAFLKSTGGVRSSHGLLCFYGYYLRKPDETSDLGKSFVVIWNPSIRKSISISLPYISGYLVIEEDIVGFGVCPVTFEPKIVKMIKRRSTWLGDVNPLWEIMVYGLNSWEWRNLARNPSDLPRISTYVVSSQVVIDRFIYWLAIDTPVEPDRSLTILSFDMTDEVCSVIDLPDSMPKQIMPICKLKESLAMLEEGDLPNTWVVWTMEHGDGGQKSFTKLFTIQKPYGCFSALGFRNNGEVLMEVADDYPYTDTNGCGSAFVCYEPDSKRINDLGLRTKYMFTNVKPYRETLLLLDQPGCYSYQDNNEDEVDWCIARSGGHS